MSDTPMVTLCLVIGDPVAHSLSPAMQSAAFHTLGLESEYRFEARLVTAEELPAFVSQVRDQAIRGVSCTIPHKVAVMALLDEIDPIAQKIGAVNTVVKEAGQLKGYNTDWLGAVRALEKDSPLAGKQVALMGAGGAARAIAYGVTRAGAKLTVFNRTVSTAAALAREFGAGSASLEDPAALETVKQMEVIINATSVGLQPNYDATPLAQEYISGTQTVLDSVYSPYETRLLQEATRQGAHIIHGTEMLLYQGMAQFELYTGKQAPESVMRAALLKSVGAEGTA